MGFHEKRTNFVKRELSISSDKDFPLNLGETTPKTKRSEGVSVEVSSLKIFETAGTCWHYV